MLEIFKNQISIAKMMARKAKDDAKVISLEEHEKIKNALHEEILRKDSIIEKLKVENELLLKTALKRADALSEIQSKSLNSYRNSALTNPMRKRNP